MYACMWCTDPNYVTSGEEIQLQKLVMVEIDWHVV